jgi:hydroxymethylglutaryl-CoA reductase
LLDASNADADARTFLNGQDGALGLADTLVENCVGWFPVPVGIVSGLVVNGVSHEVPLATEEPSVIAAASYASRLLSRSGGLHAFAAEPVMRSQVFLEAPFANAEERLQSHRDELQGAARHHLLSMEQRGGGLRGLSLKRLTELNTVVVNLDVDVRDAMGANLLNTLAEGLTPLLENLLGGKKILAILSNDASARVATARFRIPVQALAKPGFTGSEMARRIVLAAALAQADPQRAVTHNKGIMNGVSALALATGNDTRALEAGVHSWAGRNGVYRGLSTYRVDSTTEGSWLEGTLEIPLALATVGGSTAAHPQARLHLGLLQVDSSRQLCEVAAALGLAQNFAALFALAGEGIQRGHMSLHERRTKL